jgi:RNA polymerase sigma-70 factor (ECF subfamily)
VASLTGNKDLDASPTEGVQPANAIGGDDDWRDVCRVRDGDIAAFAAIVRRYNKRLYLVARGVLHNDADVDDVLQESYLKAYLKIDQFIGPTGLSAWLARITLNEAFMYLRRRRESVSWAEMETKAERPSGGDSPLLSVRPYAEKHMSLKQLRARLESAIAQLPPEFRAVFLLRAVEGLSVEGTAQHLCLEPGTVKTRYHRARKRLQIAVGDNMESLLPLTFFFAGTRCDRLTQAVLMRLRDIGVEGTSNKRRNRFSRVPVVLLQLCGLRYR